MSTYDATYRLDRTPEEVFDVIGTHCYENHPLWEREVVEIRQLTPGPIGLGSRAIMVREEFGRRSETEYEVTAFEPARRIAFRHPQGSMLFELGFDLRAAGVAATDLTVHVRAEPRNALRLLSPLIALQLPRRSDRITRRLVELVESRPSRGVRRSRRSDPAHASGAQARPSHDHGRDVGGDRG